MDLQTIFDQLTVGELRNVFMGDINDGDLTAEKKDQLIIHISMGLTALHKRFLLKEKSDVITLVPGTYRYVVDQPDLLRIEGVRDLDDNEYLLNIMNDPESLHTPNYKTLDIPKDLQTEKDVSTLEVFYRANHPKLSPYSSSMPANRVEIDLPYTHLEPLIFYVASRVVNPIGMTETFHEGNNYAQKYEMSCQQLQNEGYDIQQDYMVKRFVTNGWV